MATDIVQSLFGVTPDMYQQQQARQADARALQFAQLTPMQQAQYGIGRGAYGLAGAIGGALGAQDPELQRISARNSIAQQINYNNPESIMQGVEALSQAGDTVGAMQLATIARDLEYKQAQTSQSLAAGQASLAQAAKAARDENTVVVGNALVDRRTGQPIYRAPDGETKPVVVGNALINPATGQEIYRAPEGAPKPVVVGNALINPATGQEVYRTPEGAPKPVVVGNALVNPATGQEVYRASKDVVEPTTAELTNARAIALQAGPVGSPEYNAAFMAEYNRLTAPKDAREPTTAELTNARAVALRAGPEGTPEYNAALDAEYKRLTTKADKSPSVGGDREAVALEVYNTQFADLTPAQRAAVNKRVEAEQGRKAAATAPQIKVEMKQQEAFGQSRGKTQNELLTEATASARGASQALTAISSMKQLNDSGQLFTGPLANPAVGASNLLASVGLLSSSQVARLSSSEIYDKQAKDLVMQDLGGKLGAQISDADRKFVEARIPQLTTSAKARTELLDKLDEIQRGKISFYEKMNEHANKFGNLNTFNFAQTYAPAAPSGGWSIKKKEAAK